MVAHVILVSDPVPIGLWILTVLGLGLGLGLGILDLGLGLDNLTPSSGQKWPKYPQIMYCCTGSQHTVLGGAFGGHFGPFRADLRPVWGPHCKFWVIIQPMSPLLAATEGPITLSSGPIGWTINIK